MKKKYVLIVICFLLIVLFFPIKVSYNDGGSVEYKALIYDIKNYHEKNFLYKNGYKTGVEVKILGFTIYKNVAEPGSMNQNEENETNEKIIKINDKLYYEVKEEQDDFNRCGSEMFDGKIESNVNFSKIPMENNQSNFEGQYSYRYVSSNVIMICPNNNTLYFKAKQNIVLEDITDGILDINSDFVIDLYNKANPSKDAFVLKEMYNLENKFSNEYILSVGIVNLIREKNLKNEEYISPKDVEEQIHKIFGYNIEFKHQDVYVHSSNEYGKGVCGYWYRPNAKQYQLIHGCGGSQFEFFRRKLMSAEKKEDFIYLTEKLIYFYNDWDNYSSKRYIYNNMYREKLLDYIETSSTTTYKVDIDDYLEEASTYVYVFQNVNETYILKEILRG